MDVLLEPEMLKEFEKEFQNYMMWGAPPDRRTEEEKYLDTLKMAYVFVNENERHTPLLVSNLDNKAYKYREYYQIILPLEEVSYLTFERWWRPMDF